MDEQITTHTLQLDLTLAKEVGLTQRQAMAAAWVAEGKTDAQIGEELYISRHTAKTHVLAAMRETDTNTRAQLIAVLFVQGILTGRDSARMLVFCLVLAGTWGALPSTQLQAALDPDQNSTLEMARRLPRKGGRTGRLTNRFITV